VNRASENFQPLKDFSRNSKPKPLEKKTFQEQQTFCITLIMTNSCLTETFVNCTVSWSKILGEKNFSTLLWQWF